MNKQKLPAVILISFLVIGMLVSISYQQIMLYFMGVVLLFLGGLKLLDVKGFAHAFQKYDLFAKGSGTWARLYPFVEVTLGALFILHFFVVPAAIVLLILMVENLVSVFLVIKKKQVLMCACMGTKIKVRLTTLTLIEDVVMIVMALFVLF